MPRTYCLKSRTENDLFSSNIHTFRYIHGNRSQSYLAWLSPLFIYLSFGGCKAGGRTPSAAAATKLRRRRARRTATQLLRRRHDADRKKESYKSRARATFSRQQSYDTLRASIVAIKGHPTLLHSTENWAFMAAFLVIENFWHFRHSSA